MRVPTAKEIELLTGEAIAAVETVDASQALWPVSGFTNKLSEAYRRTSEDIDAAFQRARAGDDHIPGLVGLTVLSNERPLFELLQRMQRLESSLYACKDLNVFTSLHGGECQSYEFLDFVQQHSAKQRPHRYLVWDANEEMCCAFLTAHEVAFWWLSWVRNFEHYCQSRLFMRGSEWWQKGPLELCRRLESDAANYLKAPRLDSENLKELIRDESMAMLSTFRRSPWNRRPGTNATEWLTLPATFEASEIKVFVDFDGWPKLTSNVKPEKKSAVPTRDAGTPRTSTLFGMEIHEKSKTVERVDPLGIERTCEIKNPEQWNLLMCTIKNDGKLTKAQVHAVFSEKTERDRNVAALRRRLQEIQLTFNADGDKFVIKEFSG